METAAGEPHLLKKLLAENKIKEAWLVLQQMG
jgi:hypothetical protein